MSSRKYDQHTICSQCRDVDCSFTMCCDECCAWSNDAMADYLRHKKSLATKSKKKLATSASSSFVSPAVASSPLLGSTPRLPFVSDDAKIRVTVLSVLHALSQSGSLVTNPISFSAPSSVPGSAPQERGAAGGDSGPQTHSLGGLTRSSGVGAFELPSSVPPPIASSMLSVSICASDRSADLNASLRDLCDSVSLGAQQPPPPPPP